MLHRGHRAELLLLWVSIAPALLVAPGQAGRRDIEANGPKLNGIALRAEEGGADLSLLQVDLRPGVVLADGRLRRGVTLIGGMLRDPQGPVAAEHWIGAELTGEASNRALVRLRIDRVETAPDPAPQTAENENQDVKLFTLSYRWKAASVPSEKNLEPWQPLCTSSAIAVAGRWDYHSGQPGDGGRRSQHPWLVTFACRDAAIAKCIERGYKPWRPSPGRYRGQVVTMDVLHQACVRALRADYCGNGQSLTLPDTPINLYDVVHLKRDTADWLSEAVWSPAGALCVHGTRLSLHPSDTRQTLSGYIGKHCVERWSPQPCRSTLPTGVLWTEYAPSH